MSKDIDLLTDFVGFYGVLSCFYGVSITATGCLPLVQRLPNPLEMSPLTWLKMLEHTNMVIIGYYCCLVVTGTWLNYDFPFSWEFHHPN